MAGVPVSLPTLGADAKVGRSRVLKGPEDAAAAALLSGLAQGQPPPPRLLPAPTLAEAVCGAKE